MIGLKLLRKLRLNEEKCLGLRVNTIGKNFYCRYFSNEKPVIPDEFYDLENEVDKEFEDISAAIKTGGLSKLTLLKTDKATYKAGTIQTGDLLTALKQMANENINGDDEEEDEDPLSYTDRVREAYLLQEELEKYKTESSADGVDDDEDNDDEDSETDNEEDEEVEKEDDEITGAEAEFHKTFLNTDLDEHIKSFENVDFIPTEMLNYNIPWRTTEAFPDPVLDRFVPKTSPLKFNFNQQGYRHCPGKLQRRGMNPQFGCHLLDLDALDHLDVMTLKRFMSGDSEILPRKETGLCAKCQRKVAKAVKRSRNFGLLPHLGEYVIEDVRPEVENDNMHDVVNGASRTHSKTVL